jgi:hypothetical protein
MLVVTIIVGVVVVASVVVWRFRAGAPEATPIQRFRCSGCGQKLRYLATKAGRTVMCPNCRERCKLPSDGEAFDASREYQIRVGERRMRAEAFLVKRR